MHLKIVPGMPPRQIAELHRNLSIAWSALCGAIATDVCDFKSDAKLIALRERTREALDTLYTPFALACGSNTPPRPCPLTPDLWHEFLDLHPVRGEQAAPDGHQADDDVF